ncbi:MAG TPA: hypothetical protein ENJ93_01230 [Chloroflexi bacterium]|nr:hypothetical protein [Chloroflexota bacterium]
MLFLLFFILGGLFLGLLLLAGRAFSQSEAAASVQQSIAFSAGLRRKESDSPDTAAEIAGYF